LRMAGATSINWQRLGPTELAQLTPEQRKLVAMLADGKTQPQIAQALQMHRSAVWRRIKKLRITLQAHASSGP
jgi:DNA-binding CsgD family transcriptional regulator